MHPTSIRYRVVLLTVVLACPGLLSGQLISLKTVPVAAGDQFLIFPSENLAMGGVSIALDDRLAPTLAPTFAACITQ